ncbi:UbiA family prenyltransferase [Membranihabitans marinus]|uniref:UbiA family prenyltransferase n=1 Tax=Membranihabitans marinus TaxID=1227546 RepID=UPI001EFF89E0|nr:UbiA family prenyltransferase [Membranihabitans marinus]
MNIAVPKWLINGVSFLLESHIWLGLCAVLCTLGNMVLMDITPSKSYLLFIFFGTLTVYNFHSYYNLTHHPQKPKPHRYINIFSKYKNRLLMPFIYMSITASAIVFLVLPWRYKLLLIIPILISSAYVFPLISQRRLKEWSYLKIFALTLVWSMMCFGIPLLATVDFVKNQYHLFYFFAILSFFFALAIPFDIRDRGYDNKLNIKTLPIILGNVNSKILAMIFLLTASYLGFLTGQGLEWPLSTSIVLLLTPLILSILIWSKIEQKSSYFYPFFLDGMLFFYGGSIVLMDLALEYLY